MSALTSQPPREDGLAIPARKPSRRFAVDASGPVDDTSDEALRRRLDSGELLLARHRPARGRRPDAAA